MTCWLCEPPSDRVISAASWRRITWIGSSGAAGMHESIDDFAGAFRCVQRRLVAGRRESSVPAEDLIPDLGSSGNFGSACHRSSKAAETSDTALIPLTLSSAATPPVIVEASCRPETIGRSDVDSWKAVGSRMPRIGSESNLAHPSISFSIKHLQGALDRPLRQ